MSVPIKWGPDNVSADSGRAETAAPRSRALKFKAILVKHKPLLTSSPNTMQGWLGRKSSRRRCKIKSTITHT